MLKLIIVDDDEIMREGLAKNIKWEDNGIQIVASAGNGLEGLELTRKYLPHIVISDIKMPCMDGLEMAEKIVRELPKTKLVLLTGYEDFEYAKKALKLKVSDYILKYTDNDEILRTVLKAVKELEVEENISRNLELGRELLLNKLFNELVLGLKANDHAEKEFEMLGVCIDGNRFCTALLKPENPVEDSGERFGKTWESLMNSILKVCKKEVGSNGFVFYGTNRSIGIVFQFIQNEEIDENESILHLLSGIREKVKKGLNTEVAAGVGEIHEGYTGIPVSYNEAALALELKSVLGKEGIVFADSIKNSEVSYKTIIERITMYIANNYYKSEISLDDIAGKVHLSPTYVSTIFKKFKNINIIDYIIRLRMEKAAELLSNTDMKSYEVSEAVGYTNPQYFSVLFKKHTGFAPTEYKKAKEHGSINC